MIFLCGFWLAGGSAGSQSEAAFENRVSCPCFFSQDSVSSDNPRSPNFCTCHDSTISTSEGKICSVHEIPIIAKRILIWMEILFCCNQSLTIAAVKYFHISWWHYWKDMSHSGSLHSVHIFIKMKCHLISSTSKIPLAWICIHAAVNTSQRCIRKLLVTSLVPSHYLHQGGLISYPHEQISLSEFEIK